MRNVILLLCVVCCSCAMALGTRLGDVSPRYCFMPTGNTQASPTWIQFNEQYSVDSTAQQIAIISQHLMQFEATEQREELSLGRSFSVPHTLPHSFVDQFHHACDLSAVPLDQQMMTLLILFYQASLNSVSVTQPLTVSCSSNGVITANLGQANSLHITVTNSHFVGQRNNPERNIQVRIYIGHMELKFLTFKTTAKPDVVTCSVSCRLEAEEQAVYHRDDEDDDKDDRGCLGRFSSWCSGCWGACRTERQRLASDSGEPETTNYHSFSNLQLLLSTMPGQSNSDYLWQQLGKQRESLSVY